MLRIQKVTLFPLNIAFLFTGNPIFSSIFTAFPLRRPPGAKGKQFLRSKNTAC
jgi:hypothetical protein